jgi:pimeloyl-ACP methyl ester carboxylesterase
MTRVPVTRRYLDGRFGQLHAYQAEPETNSTQPALMCLHMSPFAAVIYEKFLGEMGRDRLALAVDTPGFGNSDAPPEPPLIGDYAAAMVDVMDALDLQTVDVMGFHTGSKTALEVARQQPGRVRKIIMVSIAFWTEAERANREVIIKAPEVTTDGSHYSAYWRELVRWSMAGRTLPMIADSFYASQLNPAITHWGHQAAYQYNVEAAMAELDKPIMVLNPEDDLWEQTPRIKPLLKHPDSQFHDLHGWAHGFLDLKTVETAALIRQFLDH